MKEIQRNANRGFAPGGMREKLETHGKLTNFMEGLTRQEYSSSARCKAPERYMQPKETEERITLLNN